MAEEFIVQMKQFNGIDYDEIYPKARNVMSPEIILIPTSGDTIISATVIYREAGDSFEGTLQSDGKMIFQVNKFGIYDISANSQENGQTNGEINVEICQQYEFELFPKADPILNNNSWDVIRKYSDAGKAESTWAVGDAKQITINGNIGSGASYDNYQPWVYILGFNHNAELEGDNRIHFGCFRSEQNYSASNSIALDDSKYNNTVSTTGYFSMNRILTNSGGWESCQMRTVILNSDASSPSSASANTFLAALPNDLKIAMKNCIKYTDNTGGGDNTASYVTATTDWVWLLSEFEIHGNRSEANSAEKNYQKQYQYYISGNSKIKYRQRNVNSACFWWCRSPNISNSNSTNFCGVRSDGSANGDIAYYSHSIAPSFCV